MLYNSGPASYTDDIATRDVNNLKKVYVKWRNKKYLRLLRTLAGVLQCPPGKNSYAHHLRGKHDKLNIVGKVNKCRFRKKYELQMFLNSAKENCKKDPGKWPCVIQSDKWINRVPKLGGYLWNLAWTFFRCCETKVCRGFLKIIIFRPWRSSMQCASRILCCSNLDRLIKKITCQNIEKCSHTFDDWFFVINTVQLFCPMCLDLIP